MKAVFLDAGSLGEGDLDLTPLHAAADVERYDRTTADTAAGRIGNAACAIVNKVPLDAATLAACPHLRLVTVVATGTNNVDIAAAQRLGITVTNCRDYGTDSVAQHVLGLVLSLTRSLPDYINDTRAGLWRESPFFCRLDHPIHELGDLTLGVIGHGTLGQAVADLCANVGMTVRVAERRGVRQIRPGRVPFERCLSGSDVVTLHCPLTAETQALIGARELAAMPAHAWLVNTARGGLVDEHALAQALETGTIAGAAVDVLSEEPPRGPNPLLDDAPPNLLVTPHCAWASRRARQRVVAQTAENIHAFRAGRPVRTVVPDAR